MLISSYIHLVSLFFWKLISVSVKCVYIILLNLDSFLLHFFTNFKFSAHINWNSILFPSNFKIFWSRKEIWILHVPDVCDYVRRGVQRDERGTRFETMVREVFEGLSRVDEKENSRAKAVHRKARTYKLYFTFCNVTLCRCRVWIFCNVTTAQIERLFFFVIL